MIAAVQSIREIFPKSSVKNVRRDDPPKVVITADVTPYLGGDNIQNKHREVWTGEQRCMFLKHQKKRRKAVNKMKTKLSELLEELVAPPIEESGTARNENGEKAATLDVNNTTSSTVASLQAGVEDTAKTPGLLVLLGAR